MDPRFWTMLVMGVCVTVLIGWDVYVAFGNRVPNERDTISGIILGWSKQAWVLPYAFGVLAGHLFVPASSISATGCPRLLCVGILIACAFMITAIGVWARRERLAYPWPIQAPILLAVGVLAGHVLWYQ